MPLSRLLPALSRAPLALLAGMLSAGLVRADATRHAVVLYGSGIQGELSHCGCASGLGGLARRAGAVDRIRGEGAPTFLLDSGDVFLRFPPGTVLARKDALPRTRRMVGWLAGMGLDAQVPSRKDLWLGWEPLLELYREAGIPLLAANREGESAPAGWRLLVRGGFRLGVVGAVGPEEGFGEAVGPVRRAVREVRAAGADAVLLLSSLGLPGDRRLLGEVEGVDVVVGGRSGERLERPITVSGVPVVQAGVRGKYLGRLDLRVTGTRVRVENRILPLDPGQTEDPLLAREVGAYLDALEAPGRGKY